jgi:hypothetical protein
MRSNKKNGAKGLLCFVSFLQTVGIAWFLASSPVSAADWSTIRRGLSVGGTFTDNANLDEDDKESEFIISMTPFVSLSGKGARLNLDFAYALNLNYGTSSNDDNGVNQRLQTTANAELARNWLFLDARAFATQTVIDSFASTGGDTINDTGNLQNTYGVELAPYMRHHFGRYSDLDVRLSYNRQWNSESANSSGNSVSARLDSGHYFGKTFWSLEYSGRSSIFSDDSETNSTQRATGTLGYVLNRKWRVNGSVGYEWGNYRSTRSDTGGGAWSIGGVWTPNVRTSLGASVGDSFYGPIPNLDFSYRHRRIRWTASYNSSLSDLNVIRTQQEVFGPGGPEGADLPVSDTEPETTSSVFVNNAFRTSFTLEGRRSTLGIDASYNRYEYQDSSQDQKVYAVGASFSRKLSGVTSFNTFLRWGRNQDKDNPNEQISDREENTWTAQMGLSRTLTPHATARFDYRYRTRDSNQPDDNYTENRITASISASWD